MPTARYDVLGIGNAIVDVIARTEEDFLLRHGMRKGSIALIDEARAQAIYDAMGPAVETSGGSAANTTVGLASLGARAAFVGKIKDDVLGRAFAHDIRAAGVVNKRVMIELEGAVSLQPHQLVHCIQVPRRTK